ncbi:hypothetical protein [Neobacillus sp. NPDC093127]|uniref:hypothetical protein n=1 Tax=Neobacillus sp. NPDC093127 TaxID=3364296 RepID=UPI0037F327D9
MDILSQWKRKLEAAREFGLYFDYRAVEELLNLVEQLKHDNDVLAKHKYFDADDQH